MSQNYISSDKTSIDVSGITPVEIARGDGTLSGFANIGGGYYATSYIKLDFLKVNKFLPEYMPDIKVLHRVDYGSMVNVFQPAPYTEVDLGDGSVTKNFSYSIQTQGVSPSETEAYLSILYFTVSNDAGDRSSAYYTQDFTWVAYSNRLWP